MTLESASKYRIMSVLVVNREWRNHRLRLRMLLHLMEECLHGFLELGIVALAPRFWIHLDFNIGTNACVLDSPMPFGSEKREAGRGYGTTVMEIELFTGVAGSEIEDLIPAEVIARELDRWLRSPDVPFAEEMQSGSPIVPQIEAWAMRHKVELPKPGWKVELAKRVKQRMLAEGPEVLSSEVLAKWEKLFAAFQKARTGAAAKATA